VKLSLKRESLQEIALVWIRLLGKERFDERLSHHDLRGGTVDGALIPGHERRDSQYASHTEGNETPSPTDDCQEVRNLDSVFEMQFHLLPFRN
jgi:hypothetical protein